MGRPTILFDVGGVLLTNAWDREQRARAATQFSLDAGNFEVRHKEFVEPLECGSLSFDAYLQATVFDQPRAFMPAQFLEFVHSCSQPLPESLAVLDELARSGRARLATLNNESAELNAYRIGHFGLDRYFSAFCSSCYLGARKPGEAIFRRALGILQAAPGDCLFIDDRPGNLDAPRSLGLATHQFTTAAELRAQLSQRGLL